jgi:hypothetical protein
MPHEMAMQVVMARPALIGLVSAGWPSWQQQAAF